MKPEYINREQLSYIDDIIKPNRLEIYKSKREILEKKVKKLEHDNEVKEKDRQKETEERKKAEKEVKKSKKEITRISNEKRKQIQDRIDDIETRKNNANKKAKRRIKLIRGIIIIILIMIVLFVFFLGKKFQLDILSYLINLFPLLLFIMSVYTGKNFESLNFVNRELNKFEEYLNNRVYYKDYNIDPEELVKLKKDLMDSERIES